MRGWGVLLLTAAVVVAVSPPNATSPPGSSNVVPLKDGWYRGRRAKYFEFAVDILPDVYASRHSEGTPRLYTLQYMNSYGVLTAVPEQHDIVTSKPGTLSPPYTGLWDVINVVLPTGTPPPTTPFKSAEELLNMMSKETAWRQVPSGSRLHCPVTPVGTTLEGVATATHYIWCDGQLLSCTSLARFWGFPPASPPALFNLLKLPTLAPVEGNTLIDNHPDEPGFTPLFTRREAHVAGNYVAGSVNSTAALDATPHGVGLRSEERLVTVHIVSIEPPWHETASWMYQVTLRDDPGHVLRVLWTPRPEADTMQLKVVAAGSSGWVGVGFSEDTIKEGYVGTELVFFYVNATGRACVRHAFASGSNITYSHDNLLEVGGVETFTDWRGTTTVVFHRRLQTRAVDSKGQTHPSAAIKDGVPGRLVVGVSGGEPPMSCNASLDFSSPTWASASVQWIPGSTTAPSSTASPVPTPHPTLPTLPPSTPAPLTVDPSTVVGKVTFDPKLSLSWTMDGEQMIFTLVYQGDLKSEARWMGVGFGGAFMLADLVSVYYDRNGVPVVDDRKGAGINTPPRDGHQDITYLPIPASDIVPNTTGVRFSRPVVTGDKGMTAQPLKRESLTPLTLARLTGWYRGRAVTYYSIDTPGGPFGDAAVPVAAPLFEFVTPTGDKITRQDAVIDVLPGQSGYSDLRRVVYITVPSGYAGAVITWAHDIPADWERRPTATFVNCPVVHKLTRLENLDDAVRFPMRTLWYRGEIVQCIAFTVSATAVFAPTVYTANATQANETIFPVVPPDPQYMGLWRVHPFESSGPLPTEVEGVPLEVRQSEPPILPGYVNRPIVAVAEVEPPPPTPIPTEPSHLANMMLLHGGEGAHIVLRWEINEAAGTMDVEVDADLGGSDGYVAIGFSNITSKRMANTDLVLAYFRRPSLTNEVCFRSMHAVYPTGAPNGFPRLIINNPTLKAEGTRVILSFVRGLDGNASTAGLIPSDPDQPARVLYAVSRNIVSTQCTATDLSSYWHGDFPHGHREIYWRHPNGVKNAPPPSITPPSPDGGLPRPLNVPQRLRRRTGWFMEKRVEYYLIENGLQGSSREVGVQEVIDVVWPPGRFPVVDRVPGVQGYSDLMKVSRLRLPDGYPGNITSRDQLVSEVERLRLNVEVTDEYWNCPVLSAKVEFDPEDVWNGTHGVRMQYMWYKDQLLWCADFGKVQVGTAVGVLYEVWRIAGNGTTFRDPLNTTVVDSAPGHAGHTPFKWVLQADVPEAVPVANITSRSGLLAQAKKVQTPAVPRIVNTPVVEVEPGTPVTLLPQVLEVKQGWLEEREVRYVEVRRPVLTRDGLVGTAETFAFRVAGAPLWSRELQRNIVDAVPGLTVYSDLWRVIMVEVPPTESEELAKAPITHVSEIPSSWRRTPTGVILNCPVLNQSTTLSEGEAPQLVWYFRGQDSHCLLLGHAMIPVSQAGLHQAPKVYIPSSPPAVPIFDTWPRLGFFVPHTFDPAGGVSYRSAERLRNAALTPSREAQNWPIIWVGPSGYSPRKANMTSVAGLYRGKSLTYWLVGNSSTPVFRNPAKDAVYTAVDEDFVVHTTPVYIFRFGNTLGAPSAGMDPVFAAAPGEEAIVNGTPAGYSDLKRVVVVTVPNSASSSTPPMSEAEIVTRGWVQTAVDGVYYNWPLCTIDSDLPLDIEPRRGWYKGMAVYYAPLSEQSSRGVLRAYRVASGKLVFPYLPQYVGYTAFHTVWSVPEAPDTFDPLADLSAHRTARPESPDLIYNVPLLSNTPSASTEVNEVDRAKEYRRLTGWLGRREVGYYAFSNTPASTGAGAVSSQPAYYLRFGTALSAKEVQGSPIVPHSPGGEGYSDLHEVRVVQVGALPGSIPVTSVRSMQSMALEGSWSILPTGLFRVAPMVHAKSTLAAEADRLLYPMSTVYQGGRAYTVFDFGFTSKPDPITVHRVISPAGRSTVIFGGSPAIPAPHFCQEIRLFPPSNVTFPVTAVNQSWQGCEQWSESDCPTMWCIFASGSCTQPEVSYTCPIVHIAKSTSAEALQPYTLRRLSGWHKERQVTYYQSPSVIPGNASQAFTSKVFVFKRPATDSVPRADVPNLSPVFEDAPGMEGYSDLHVIVEVTVPYSYMGGAVSSASDVLSVSKSQGWTVTVTGSLVNWWVVHPETTVEGGGVEKRTAFLDGQTVAFLDFGAVATPYHNTRYTLVRTGGERVEGNAVFSAVPESLLRSSGALPYTPIVWEVLVAVPADYKDDAFTSVTHLQGYPQATQGRILNNPIVAVNSPISPLAYDDLDIDPAQGKHRVLWAYGPLDPSTLLLRPCVERGALEIDFTEPPTPAPQLPTTNHKNPKCTILHALFTLCWYLERGTDAQFRAVFTVTIRSGFWGSFGLSRDGTMNGADVWLLYHDTYTTHITDRWSSTKHGGLPPLDMVQRGGHSLYYLGASSEQHLSYNLSFTRPLDTGDTTSDIAIAEGLQWMVWAVGRWEITKGEPQIHEASGVLKVDFYTGEVSYETPSSRMWEWWVLFTILVVATVVVSACILTYYSPKSAMLHHSLVFGRSLAFSLTGAELCVVLVYLALLGLWIGMYTQQYSKMHLRVPGVRGFGAGAILAFSCVLLPLARSSPLLYVFGISVQRAARWHKWNNMVLLLLVLVHGLGMILTYNTDALGWESGEATRQPGLAGFLTFAGLLFQAFITIAPCGGPWGWIRRQYYEHFVTLHQLGGVWVFVFAHLHHPPLIYATIVPIILFGLDRLCAIYQYLLAIKPGRSVVVSYDNITHPRESSIGIAAVEIKVLTADHTCWFDPFRLTRLQPLQHVLLSVANVGSGWHPVNISSRPVHTESDTLEPFKGKATTTFTLHIRSDATRPSSWSRRVYELCSSRRLGRVNVMGPYGRPSIDLRQYEHLLLIGGGAGGVPLMGILEFFLDSTWGKQVPAGPSRCRVITLVWAAKHRSMFNMFATKQPIGALRMALDVAQHEVTYNQNFQFRPFLHQTHQPVNPFDALTAGVPSEADELQDIDELQDELDQKAQNEGMVPIRLVNDGRPNLFQRDGANLKYPNVFDELRALNELRNPDTALEGRKVSSIGVVACGPHGMLCDVKRSIEKHNSILGGLSFHLHVEKWEG
eukprot:Sspe_Gene.7405::Locus_2511_Transcript_1_1_Confidence_1.000_Length_9464::g.7405::m.7405